MKTVNVPGTDITTTAVGFGCSNLLGDKTRDEGIRLLHTAYDAGVRHFDVARYYGFGGAESLVGEFARGKRDRITITTKFGIQPPIPDASRVTGTLQNQAIQIARHLVRLSPFIRDLARRNMSRVVKGGQFDVSTAKMSLETSLRELGTDYIDIYLLHECSPEDCQPSLLAFLEQARREGKIKSFGIGTSIEATEAICAYHPEYATVIQFQSDITNRNVEKAKAFVAKTAGKRAIITHGSMGTARALMRRLQEESGLAAALLDDLGMDGTDPAVLSALIMQQALRANPDGIVLFRSESPERIRSNVRAVSEPQVSAEQVERFESLLSA
jgi:aryl-alcohol dehydrogenase-like predicted oxidoreductase